MNKTGSQQKLFATRLNATSRVSSCSAPSQHLLKPLFIVKIIYNYGIKAVAGRSTASGLGHKGRFKGTVA